MQQNPAGHLTARGTLFMRAGLYTQRTSAGHQQVLLSLLERRDKSFQHLTATWCGPEAEEFLRLYGASVKAGTALHCEFSRVYCHNNELHAVIESVYLATPRWADKPARPDDADIDPRTLPATLQAQTETTTP